jgi:hypothetical protein
MKKITLMLTPLLMVVALNANSKKVDQEMIENTVQHKVEEPTKNEVGSTMREYSKPGAAIDMDFNTTRVNANEISDVNITLRAIAQKGTLDVLVTLDENLSAIGENLENNLSFTLSPEQHEFKIDFQVKSAEDGLYYVKLLTKIDKGYGPKLRSFAVPVYIGEKPKSLTRSSEATMKALDNGERISVSKASETIEVIK